MTSSAPCCESNVGKHARTLGKHAEKQGSIWEKTIEQFRTKMDTCEREKNIAKHMDKYEHNETMKHSSQRVTSHS